MSKKIEPFLNDIYKRLHSGHAAIMVGAGFSKNALGTPAAWKAFPEWGALGDIFFKKVNGKEPSPSDRYLNPLKLANEVEVTFSRSTLDNILQSEIPDERYEPSQLHTSLLQLPWVDIFTTNYDTLIERARVNVPSRKYDLVISESDLIYSTSPRIIKLHGSFPSNKPFIITEEDYRKYPKDFALFVNSVQQCLIENTLCLTGFSGDDPNFLNWIGWIRDNLGEKKPPKIYLIGTFELSEGQKHLLVDRNIVVLEMSEYSDVEKGNHEQALQKFMSIMNREPDSIKSLAWPTLNDTLSITPNTEYPDLIPELYVKLKNNREQYPNWFICPVNKREILRRSISEFINSKKLFDCIVSLKNIELLFEINWVWNTCLLPLSSHIREAVIQIVNDVDYIQSGYFNEWYELALALLRMYRQEGRKDDWLKIQNLIQTQKIKNETEITQNVAFYYEQVLFAKNHSNQQEVKDLIDNWPASSYAWQIRKVMLQAELGDRAKAKHQIKNILMAIRSELNLVPIESNYELISLESYAIFYEILLDEAGEVYELDFDGLGAIRKKSKERLNQLDLYECSPWKEYEYFTNVLKQPNSNLKEETTKYQFDLNRVKRTMHLGDNESLLCGYSFLLFCEKISFPHRFCYNHISEAAGKIFNIDIYMALESIINSGAYIPLDSLLTRNALYNISSTEISELISSFITRFNLLDQSLNFHEQRKSLDTKKSEVLIEIISKLLIRASGFERDKVIELFIGIHNKNKVDAYETFGHLTERLCQTMTQNEFGDYAQQLISLPIHKQLTRIEKHHFRDPWEILITLCSLRSVKLNLDNIPIAPSSLIKLVGDSNDVVSRQAQFRFHALELLGLIPKELTKEFISKLWDGVDNDEMPDKGIFTNEGYLNQYFLNKSTVEEILTKKILNQYSKSDVLDQLDQLLYLTNQTYSKPPLIRLSEKNLETVCQNLWHVWSMKIECIETTINNRLSFFEEITPLQILEKVIKVISEVVIVDNLDSPKIIQTISQIIQEAEHNKIPCMKLKVRLSKTLKSYSKELEKEILFKANSTDGRLIKDVYQAVYYASKFPGFTSEEKNLIEKTLIRAIKYRLKNRTVISMELVTQIIKFDSLRIEPFIPSLFEGISYILDETSTCQGEKEEDLHALHNERKACFSLLKAIKDNVSLNEIERKELNIFESKVIIDDEFRDISISLLQ